MRRPAICLATQSTFPDEGIANGAMATGTGRLTTIVIHWISSVSDAVVPDRFVMAQLRNARIVSRVTVTATIVVAIEGVSVIKTRGAAHNATPLTVQVAIGAAVQRSTVIPMRASAQTRCRKCEVVWGISDDVARTVERNERWPSRVGLACACCELCFGRAISTARATFAPRMRVEEQAYGFPRCS